MRTDMRTSLLALALLGFSPACGGGGEDSAKSKLASDLVTCKNDLVQAKRDFNEAKGELAQAKKDAQENGTVHLAGVELHGGLGLPQQEKEGNIPPDDVIKVLKQNVGALRTCYEHALKRKPDLQHVQSVSSRFAVKNTGQAIDISFSPHADADMEKCMKQSMEKWKFPAFQGGAVTFDLPINLVSK